MVDLIVIVVVLVFCLIEIRYQRQEAKEEEGKNEIPKKQISG